MSLTAEEEAALAECDLTEDCPAELHASDCPRESERARSAEELPTEGDYVEIATPNWRFECECGNVGHMAWTPSGPGCCMAVTEFPRQCLREVEYFRVADSLTRVWITVVLHYGGKDIVYGTRQWETPPALRFIWTPERIAGWRSVTPPTRAPEPPSAG